MVSRQAHNLEIAGSSPASATRKNLPNQAGVAQLVEHDLAKIEAVGSNPISRSTFRVSFFDYLCSVVPFIGGKTPRWCNGSHARLKIL